jgi:hypothetical protein
VGVISVAGSRRITVGEGKAYDTSDHVAALRKMNITPHVAQNDSLTKTGKHRSMALCERPSGVARVGADFLSISSPTTRSLPKLIAG